MLISEKANFRARKIIGDKEGHYTTMAGSILQEDIIIFNVHAPNNRALKSLKQKWIELHGETDKCTTTVGGFNTPLSATDRGRRQKISKDTVDPSSTIHQLHLIDVFRRVHPTAECTLFPRSHETVTKTDHILDHETHLKKFKRSRTNSHLRP